MLSHGKYSSILLHCNSCLIFTRIYKTCSYLGDNKYLTNKNHHHKENHRARNVRGEVVMQLLNQGLQLKYPEGH